MNNNEILNKYIDLIDKGYCCDCNELNCIDNFPQAKITHAIRKLQQENKILKEKLDKYENPEDMTLMVMWCTEKVKEENQKLQTIANNCKRLKDNWNKLREWIVYNKHNENTEQHYLVVDYGTLLGKMQELEQGDDK